MATYGFLWPIALFAAVPRQSNQSPCASSIIRPAPQLKNLNSSQVTVFQPSGEAFSEDSASSILVPTSRPANSDALNEWCGTYSSSKAQDGKPSTAWCEGVQGEGIGEVLLGPVIQNGDSVEIWAGYGKTRGTFVANNRPRQIKVYVLLVMEHSNGDAWTNLIPVAENTVELADLNQFQPLPLPKFSNSFKILAKKCQSFVPTVDVAGDRNHLTTWHTPYYQVGIKLLSIFPGQKFTDTCISEIRLVQKRLLLFPKRRRVGTDYHRLGRNHSCG